MQTPKSTVFLIHLGISTAIAIALIAVMYWLWFPGELFAIAGGWQGLKLILAVDLVLGPSLTLLIYRPGKKSAVFDLCVIALVQSLALGWGVSQAFDQRVAALVFAEGQFIPVAAGPLATASAELSAAGLKPRKPSELDAQHPAQLVAEPFNRETYGQYMADILNGLPELQERSDRFVALRDGYASISNLALDKAQLRQRFPRIADIVIRAAGQRGCETIGCDYYALKAKYGSGVVIAERDKRQLVQVITLRDD